MIVRAELQAAFSWNIDSQIAFTTPSNWVKVWHPGPGNLVPDQEWTTVCLRLKWVYAAVSVHKRAIRSVRRLSLGKRPIS